MFAITFHALSIRRSLTNRSKICSATELLSHALEADSERYVWSKRVRDVTLYRNPRLWHAAETTLSLFMQLPIM